MRYNHGALRYWRSLGGLMQPISSLLRRTSHQVRRQQELFALRARKASTSFAAETRDAGRDLASAVRSEADVWSKYVRDTASAVTDALTPHSLAHAVLVQASLGLRALDTRVRQRIHSFEGRKRARTRVKQSNGAPKARVKRAPVVARAH
jgi:hypothetical protein